MLRLGRFLRDAASTPLGLSRKSTIDTIKSGQLPKAPSIGNFFDEKYFWTKANIGPFFTGLLLLPIFYTAAKDMYWTRQMRQVNTAEIVSERFEWLRKEMLKDEVYAEALKKVPAAGFSPVKIGPDSP